MRIRVLAVGKIKAGYLSQGLEEYGKRLTRYARFAIREVKEEPFVEPLSRGEKELVLRREGDRLLAELKPRVFVFALDRLGQSLSSKNLAEQLQGVALAGTSQIDFVIGGSLGLDHRVLQRADLALSFSKFTFPHQLMRLILVEQIYRAFTIINNERYHK